MPVYQYSNFTTDYRKIQMKVSEILRTLRLKNKLSIQNMADELGLAYSTYQSYESDDGGKIQINTLNQIATFYKLNLLDLLSYSTNEGVSYVLEPVAPAYGKKGNALKIIIELDGMDETLNYWFARLKKLNKSI